MAAAGLVVARGENEGSSRVCDTLVFVGCTFVADKQKQGFVQECILLYGKVMLCVENGLKTSAK